MNKPAKEILAKLCVRPGFQRTTYTVRQQPLVCVDFLYDRPTARFAVRVSWPLKTKTAYLQADDVMSKSHEKWAADKTYRLTEDAIARLAPGLDKLLTTIQSTVDGDLEIIHQIPTTNVVIALAAADREAAAK